MTVTGDWTMVDNKEEQQQSVVPSSTPTEAEVAAFSSALMEISKEAASRFPCSEKPPRFALRCNGHYLGGTKKGRLVGRKKRGENDEWTIAFCGATREKVNSEGSPPESGATSTVTIHNHKFSNTLSLVPDKNSKEWAVACVSLPDGGSNDASTENDNDLSLQPSQEEDGNNDAETKTEALPADEDETNDDDEDDGDRFVLATTADQEDLQWCVIRCSRTDAPNGGIMIVSLKTGDSLGVDSRGTIFLTKDEPSPVWEMECVTGELCFLSNPAIDARIRCDMAGLLTLSPNWKGWEVVRITEVAAPYSSNGGIGEGYVRISSWMHNQWFLCSDSDGSVSTCSVADAVAGSDDPNDTRCSKWAIERYPNDEQGQHEGVIIRSVTHGRLLSIRDGVLLTFDSLDDSRNSNNQVEDSSGVDAATEDSATATDESAIVPQNNDDNKLAGIMKHHADEFIRKRDHFKRKSDQWWKQSLTNVQKALSDSAIQRRNSKLVESGQAPVTPTGGVPQETTIVWQLESAHLQTYYFLSTPISVPEDGPALSEQDKLFLNIPRSIGVFPSVTDNLRKSDKIQLVRDDNSPDTLKLYLPDEGFYITCSSKGRIAATKQEEDEGSLWFLEEQPNDGGSVFRNKAHGLYLSFQTEAAKTPPPAAFEEPADEATPEIQGEDNQEISPSKPKFKNPFENVKLPQLPHQKPKPPMAELYATETPMIWKLEPCTPRAISSKRLRTFAIGTSIAVGTTIAMPFALAGVAAAMGALGAEAGIGFGIVAAAATGAEALASVGAIGATAYFCFRPEKNSLADDLETTGDDANPWCKRPFSNWRNW